jgi:general secretion pathway protein G
MGMALANPGGMMRKIGRVWARGLTLVEIMVVIVIMGLISAGIAAAVMTRWQEARIRTTEQSARSLRQIAVGWRLSHEIDACPTAIGLFEEHAIDEAARVRDAWGTPFEIACDADRTVVRSFGPDRAKGTQDDIVIPAPPTS